MSDLAAHTRETGVITYIALEACAKRDAEIFGMRTATSDTADLSDPLKRRDAYIRRGIAMEMTSLMKFDVHQQIVDMYFAEVARDPLEGFHAVSFAQTVVADREVFRMLAELTRHGFSPGVFGTMPLTDLSKQSWPIQRSSSCSCPGRHPLLRLRRFALKVIHHRMQ